MIPVLHPADSTSWASFGLGALSDAISCEVTEERNGQYELEMTYPVSGQHYSELALRKIILAKPNFNDPPQPFRIYEISRPLNGIVTVSAQHLSYDLSGYVDGPFSAVGVQSALVAMTANCTPSPCPFSFYSDMSTTGTMDVRKPTSIRALMGGSEGSLVDHWRGEWSYNGYTCRFDANRGTDRGVTIRYGKNLTSLKQEENNAAVYTGIYPFWFNQDTKVLVTLQEKTINAPGTFTFTKICPVDLSDKFEEAPTEAQLRSAAQSYISSHDIGVPDVSLELGFVQLEEIQERVDLCDTVHVYFDELGVNAAAKCVRTSWNVLSEQYSKIELGSIRASIAGTIAGIRETADQAYTATSTLADTARNVSERITGQLGGYVVMNDTDNDGQPDEILIMDSPDKETAVNVIRMNNGGIAFSQDGYHGTYGTAWSIDGHFVADYITSGVLQANLIRILGTTNFYWDAGNIYIINPQDANQQIRIGQYDGSRYGIGFTRDGGVTWQTAMDFQGLNVSAAGFSKTYVSMTAPVPSDYGLDTFNIGDVWVKSERRYNWNEVGENTWTWAAQHTWDQLGGAVNSNMYTWNGGSWQKIYDGESFVSFETRLTVAEQEIDMAVASVASKGVTYVQLTDPRNDSGVTVNLGDHWIKADPGYSKLTWNRAATYTWNALAATFDWNGLGGPKEYAWDGYEWILVADHGAVIHNTTMINETDRKITLMAQAQTEMNDQLVENTAQLTIQANQIATEVSQRKNGETQMSSRIAQNAQAIEAEVRRASDADNTLEQKTRFLMTSGLISLEAFTGGKNGSAMGVLTKAGITVDSSGKIELSALSNAVQGAVNKAAGITVDSSGKIVLSALSTTVQGVINKAAGITVDSNGKIELSALSNSVQGVINKAAGITVDADGKITLAALSNNVQGVINKAANISVDADGKILLTSLSEGVYTEQSGIAITSSGIEISASKKLTIASDGKFVVTSTNFNIDDNGNVSMTGRITSTAGTIGGWTIGQNSLKNGTGQYTIALNNANPTTSGQPVIYAGGEGTNAPFYVTRGGDLHATSATIRGSITVDSISFSSGVTMNASNLTDGSIGGGKISNGAVTKVKTSSGVQSSLNNGDTAKAAYDSLVAGSITAGYLRASNLYGKNLFVGYSSGYRSVSWKTISISGTSYTLLGY